MGKNNACLNHEKVGRVPLTLSLLGLFFILLYIYILSQFAFHVKLLSKLVCLFIAATLQSAGYSGSRIKSDQPLIVS